MPVAPLGLAGLTPVICGVPSFSTARTSKVCRPASKGQSYLQITQVVSESGDLSRASCQGPSPSTRTSTRDTPRAPAKAIPPIGMSRSSSLSMIESIATVSTTEVVWMRATSSQPRSTQ